MYARIENNAVVEWPIESLHQRFPNTSFPAPITDADLPDSVVRVHAVAPPPYNPQTHKPEQDSAPVFRNQRWELGYTLAALTQQEAQELATGMSQQVRAERNTRLAASDWTQVADAPVDQAAWAAYRQALRDVTAQPGFPFAVTWPATPV